MTDNKITNSLFWTFTEKVLAQFIMVVVTIVLARLLQPRHYGMVAIAMVFISVCNIFVTTSFGTALVQKKKADNLDFNTAFFLSLGISLILYIFVFIYSPYIAIYYDMPDLKNVMRVIGIILPLSSMNSIQQAHIQRNMNFKKSFISTSLGTLLSGFLGIITAFLGAGVWALVLQQFCKIFFDTIILNIIGDWKPSFEFNWKRFVDIWSFGSKVLATSLVFTLENDIRSLVVGRMFGSADLAFFDQGKKFPALIINNVNVAINKVMLPSYSQVQDDLFLLKKILRQSIRISTFIVAPVMVGFAAVSDSFVQLILTDKWMFCVPYIQIFSFSYLTRPLEESCHQALLGLGKSTTVFWIMVVINIFAMLTVFISVLIIKSVFSIALFSFLVSLVSVTCFMIFSGKYIGYTINEQIEDIFPSIICTLVMGTIVYCENFLNCSKLNILLLQIISGIICYVILSMIFNKIIFLDLLSKFGLMRNK